MENIEITAYQHGQEQAIYELIKCCFDEFVAKDYTDEGIAFFYNWIGANKIAQRQSVQNNILLAIAGSEIAGMIEIRDNNHVSLLFTDKKFKRKGIAKALFLQAVKRATLLHPSINKFYVHASPYSVPFYKKLGFSETNSMQENNGIKYFPMETYMNES